MQPNYQPIYEQARHLQFKIQDITSNPQSPSAIALHSEAERLAEELNMHKDPRAIESRIKNIQSQLRQFESSSDEIMSTNHSMELHDAYEHIRMNVRSLPHY
ncbi:MAG TPA: hypothetical protein VLE51_02540 [Candidatus Saccharimonadales bacterium]|nr:hypothetical protein [Candidatus Saccharimonadales bacterium]